MRDRETNDPFGFQAEESLAYATTQFTKRLSRIERARTQTVEQSAQEADEPEARKEIVADVVDDEVYFAV